MVDARQDAEVLDVVVNGDENASTVNRAGKTVNSYAKDRALLTEQYGDAAESADRAEAAAELAMQGSGAIYSKTYAALPELGSGDEGQAAAVWADPDEEKNGYYVWDGETWQRSAIQPIGRADLMAVEHDVDASLRGQRQLASQGDAIDMFLGDAALDVHRLDDASVGSTPPYVRREGGGLDVYSASTGALAHYLCASGYRLGSGVSRFTLSIDIVTGSTDQAVGLAFGDDASVWRNYAWHANGAIVARNAAGSVGPAIAGVDSGRSYTTGDTLTFAMEVHPDGSAILSIARGVERQQFRTDAVPAGPVWLSYKGGGGTGIYRQVRVEAISALGVEQAAAGQPIDLFPDPAFTGASAANLWNGTTTTEDGEIIGVFGNTGASIYSWILPATDTLRPGAQLKYRFTRVSDGSGSSAARNSLVFYDATGAEISRVESNTVTTANVKETKEINTAVPANTARVGVWAGGHLNAVSQVKQWVPQLYSDKTVLRMLPAPSVITDRRVFVSKSGSDSGTGSSGSPLASFAAAVANERLAGGGEIILLNGEFPVSGVSLASITGPVSIQSRYGQRARLTRNVSLGAISKTSGATKVYQATCATSPVQWAWEHGVPDVRTTIPLEERSAYQKGRPTRLPATRLRSAASIGAIDSADDDDPCWYWESGVLYFSIYGGGDASGSDIRVPINGDVIVSGAGARVEMIGVDVWYGRTNFTSAASGFLHDVFAFATRGDGIGYDRVGRFITEYCEAAAAENDGINSTNTADPNFRDSVGMHRGNWCHDNWGDGHSDHACSLIQFDGGLYEFNGKAGIVPANGSHAIARNSHARNNGLITPNGGGGFAITNANSSWDAGIGTQFDLYGCVSEDNPYNYMCGPADGGGGGTTSTDHAMRLHACISRAATVAGYYARVGRMSAYDCRDVGSAAATLTADGGVIEVVTTAALAE